MASVGSLMPCSLMLFLIYKFVVFCLECINLNIPMGHYESMEINRNVILLLNCLSFIIAVRILV